MDELSGRAATAGRWTERLAGLLLVVLVLLWVGAKVHFFTRFGASTVEGYLQEHWPFWAGMALVSLILFVLGAAQRRKER